MKRDSSVLSAVAASFGHKAPKLSTRRYFGPLRLSRSRPIHPRWRACAGCGRRGGASSPRARSRPRSLRWPACCRSFIWPNTGSTIAAPGVSRLAGLCPKASCHTLLGRRVLRDAPFGAAMTRSSWLSRPVATSASRLPSASASRFRSSSNRHRLNRPWVVFDPGEYELGVIASIIGQLVDVSGCWVRAPAEDDLGLLVDDGLSAVASSGTKHPRLHDARLGIGEVALGLCGRCRLSSACLTLGRSRLGRHRHARPCSPPWRRRALWPRASNGLHCLTHLRDARLRVGESEVPRRPAVRAKASFLFPVDRLGLSEDLAHLGIELFDLLFHVVKLMPCACSRGPQLGAVEGDPSSFRSRLLRTNEPWVNSSSRALGGGGESARSSGSPVPALALRKRNATSSHSGAPSRAKRSPIE